MWLAPGSRRQPKAGPGVNALPGALLGAVRVFHERNPAVGDLIRRMSSPDMETFDRRIGGAHRDGDAERTLEYTS